MDVTKIYSMETVALLKLDRGISRIRFVAWGAGLCLLKGLLDRAVATLIFGKEWLVTLGSVMDGTFGRYYMLGDSFGSASKLLESREEISFHLILLVMALPFMLAGLSLCYRRLKVLRIHPWTLIFFFIPYLQLLYFGLLAAVGPDKVGVNKGRAARMDWLGSYLPASKFGAAAGAVGLAGAFGLGMAFFSANVLNLYGGFLFVGLPFCLGFLSTLLYVPAREVGFKEHLGVALGSLGLVALALLLAAMEGVICIAMAAPIATGLAGLGVLLGRAVLCGVVAGRSAAAVLMALMPLLMGFESAAGLEASLFEIRTSLEVEAPREKVWKEVVAFSRLAEPEELMFKLGIAYPTHATITGKGVGAVRECHFSTGTFVEPITAWQEPALLAFDVAKQPAPMFEMSPYAKVHAPHLEGFLSSERGRFRLEATASGGTRLEGTTWYSHHLWPEAYWRLWSDPILHAIHLRVLRHIKAQAERAAS